MRIDKINDNQIRFILTKEDLEQRQIRISELAYGTDKARQLFSDMMQQASRQYGFVTDDMPLMIEAIPMSGDNITIIVTKVDNPEELDPRFANFAPGISQSAGDQSSPESPLDQLIDSLRHIA